MKHKVINIDFELIKSIWNKYLWPNRKSEIKSHSSMTLDDSYNMNIYNSLASYWGISYDGQIVGCNSGFKTDKYHYRSRGLWVSKEFRNKGLSKQLFNALFNQAIYEQCKYVWSIPRMKSLYAYLAVGFKQVSEPFDKDMEFGPNCYVIKEL